MVPLVFLILFSISTLEPENNQQAVIGDLTATFTLEQPDPGIVGLAYRGRTGSGGVELWAIDRTGTVQLLRSTRQGKGRRLVVVDRFAFPDTAGSPRIAPPRGLARTADGWFLTLEYHRGAKGTLSRLWWFNRKQAGFIDLGGEPQGLGQAEILGVAAGRGHVRVSYVAADKGPARVRRGILALTWTGPGKIALAARRHLPDSGRSPCRRLAWMALPKVDYLWGTVGKDRAYLATGRTCRGLFHFVLPERVHRQGPTGMTYGDKDLWVSSGTGRATRIHGINVYRNPYRPRLGPRHVRHLHMTIHTRPEKNTPGMGWVRHWFSRPYDTGSLQNQGILTDTEKVRVIDQSEGATIRLHTIDPGGDRSCRQFLQGVEYPSGPAREYRSRYDIDCWTRACRRYVYPHLATRGRVFPPGTDYTADDPVLYNLKDKGTYERFIIRVKDYCKKIHGEPADMDNPYWAARNIVEYIQDHYYYPNRSVGYPAAVDYDNRHYDANPGNLKIALSERPYDRTQIIACSGTSVVVAGAMRHLGYPTRWLGTGVEKGPKEWDRNRNGLMDPGERARCDNGHRLSQVWLGSGYGWIIFDATPSRAPGADYSTPPRPKNQWRFMDRAAGGLRKSRRLVFNVGSQFIKPLYRDFEYDARLAKDNNCGGDQRYNLQGRFEKPELWHLARHRIFVTAPCRITDIRISGPAKRTRITWQTSGPWHLDPPARLEIHLIPSKGRPRKVAGGIPWRNNAHTLDLTPLPKGKWRLRIRKVGDPVTGGISSSRSRRRSI